MSNNQKQFKFIFIAQITQLVIKAKISSPVIATWKRSSQTVSTASVDIKDGKALINQTIKLPVNMYQDMNTNLFVEKKSAFNFTMNTNKGDKSAGTVHVDLAPILNQKMTSLEKDFILQKCPVKQSYVHIKITGQCVGQKGTDTISLQNESFVNNDSMLEINEQSLSKKSISQSKQISKNQETQKDKRIKQLQMKVSELQKNNKQLKQQIKSLKSGSQNNQKALKTSNKSFGQQNQVQLSKVRNKLQFIYESLKKNFSNLP